MYHFALPELQEAVNELGYEDAADMLKTMIVGPSRACALCSPDGLTRRSGSNCASTSGTAKNASRGRNPEARHLRGLTLAPIIRKKTASHIAGGWSFLGGFPLPVG